MVDFLTTDFDEIEKYFIDNIEAIEIIDILKIDKFNFNKLDMLILTKYGYRNKDYIQRFLPLILSFNNLADITEIGIGTILKFPDLSSLLEHTEELEIYINDSIPGVHKVGRIDLLTIDKKSGKNNNTGLPKLNITLPKVSYEPSTGIITY